MILTETTTVGGWMRLEIPKIEIRRVGRDRRSTVKASLGTQRGFTRRQITELLFDSCTDCGKMAAIPQGAFAAHKVRYNEERAFSMLAKEENEKDGKENIFNSRPSVKGWELMPLKYNSKLMNSIWGLYNRYSVHNFKKNTDAKEGARAGVAVAIWGAILENHPPAANVVAAAAGAESPRNMWTGNGL